MIIFGWGRQTIKEIGVAFKQLCGHCNNEEYWVLTRVMTWFTLFFIPIFPYSIKYFLSCPICKYGLTLDDNQVNEIRPSAENNKLLLEGKITQAEYEANILQPKTKPSPFTESYSTEVREVKTTATVDSNLTYCGTCGTNLTKNLNFCGNCGTGVEKK